MSEVYILTRIHISKLVMKLNKNRFADNRDDNITRLIIITIFLVCGAIIGSFIGAEVSGEEDWIWEYLHISHQQFFRRSTIINLILLLVVFLGGYTPLAFISAAAVSVFKGFIAAMPITSVVRLYGVSGYFIASEKGMICNLTSLLSILIMSMLSLELSCSRRNNRFISEMGKVYALSLCICATIIIFGAAIDGFLL